MNALLRTPEAWKEIFADLTRPYQPSPVLQTQADGSTVQIADRILGDIHAYPHHSRHRPDDAEQLANALIGYVRHLAERETP